VKISSVIITLNEEFHIERCLKSLIGVVDEVIIVDSGSIDNTQKIAESYSFVKFVKKDWEGYSKTKNYGNELVKFDWILSIDADEALSSELQQSILELKNKKNQELCVYEFNRITNYCGQWIRYAGWYPDKKQRLFPKNYAKWQGDFVHEILVFQIPVRFLKGDLLHYSYQNFIQHKEKTLKYAHLHAQQLSIQGKKFNYFKQYFSSFFVFFKMYFLKLGFLEGKLGWKLCWISAWGAYKKYEILKKLIEKS